MRLALGRENRVRPLIFLLRHGYRRGSGLRFNSPILWGRLDAPDVSRFFERKSNQPETISRSQGDTICDASGRASSTGKFIQHNPQTGLQWPTQANTATLSVDH